ncbi:hypothetical protein [Catellatospora chokoriensis]|uniref:Uncharacterized protein n=1 Tax=Catellatospora chokoriensis TaxID=310353 RepID=A0A8J3NSV1_9ACTN|nr:hypothetical protein [Catellatospora chokoriensis]GIF91377.1 hypothetical protein Cch02nite_48210 [Catellatospora chokoriensis]
MSRALAGRPALHHKGKGCPDWCAGAHHCTANRLPSGEHASIPEVWLTDLGRLVATRYRDHAGNDRVELRVVLALADDETTAQAQARHLLAVTHMVVTRVFGPDKQEGHLR